MCVTGFAREYLLYQEFPIRNWIGENITIIWYYICILKSNENNMLLKLAFSSKYLNI